MMLTLATVWEVGLFLGLRVKASGVTKAGWRVFSIC